MNQEAELTKLRETIQYLKDRQDILDVIYREARGRDRHDVEVTASCYWPDGKDEHGPVPFSLKEYPKLANDEHAAAFAANCHNITNHNCELDGDNAYCESYVVGGLLSRDGKTCTFAPGRYIDHLQRRNGEWRILWRRSIVDMAGTADSSWLLGEALKGYLKGVRSHEDVSYQRPIQIGATAPRW
jgi:hypothetical protein